MKKADKKQKKQSEPASKPAIVFDFDGTLMDTDPAVIVSYRYLFDKYKKAEQFTQETEFEVTDEVPAKIMKKYFPRKNTEKCVYEYLIYQHDHMRDLIQPMKDVETLLAYLKKQGYPVLLVSGRNEESLYALLDSSGLTGYFDQITALQNNDNLESGEMQSTDLVNACKAVNAEHAVYISDNAANIAAARAGGAFTVGFLSDTRKTAHLVEAGPDFMTGEMLQIKKLLNGEPYWMAYELTQ